MPEQPLDPYDAVLLDRFSALAHAGLAPTTSIGALRARVATRRRRRRVLTGAATAAVVLLAGLAAAVALPDNRGDRRVTTGATTTRPPTVTSTTLPSAATPDSGVRLGLGPTPDGLAFRDCSMTTDGIVCRYDDPTTAPEDGVNIYLATSRADAATLRAWDARDAPVFSALIRGEGSAGETFTTLGGRPAVQAKPAPPLDGDSFDLPDLAWRSYDLLLDGHHVQVTTGTPTSNQADRLAAGLSLDPVDPGFTLPDGVLPADARLLAQGSVRLWDQPDPIRPELSSESPGNSLIAAYAVPGHETLLQVQLTTGVDAADALDAADQREVAGPGAARTTVGDRDALIQAERPEGMTAQQLTVVAVVDARTIVTVTGPPGRAELTQQVATTITQS